MSTELIKMETGKRILLVDDEPDITMAISIALEADGFEVHSYNSPKLALFNFKPDYYDLAILDIMMPEMDGFRLYNQMKNIDGRIEICFITAADKTYYEGPQQEQKQNKSVQEKISPEYCALNEEIFIQKPISNGDLIREIKKRMKN
ncbi:MAG: response regulator [Nitrososphaeraceae archaeon]|jgi:CheY-like chemotaxis protein